MDATGISAQAGRRGAEVRSDCWVQVTLAESGGIDLRLTSKVESLYGGAIRELVADELRTLGISNARVEVEDSGALPFVIMARVEAAVRRVYAQLGKSLPSTQGYLPEFEAHARYPGARERFRRSRLYLPGNEPRFMLNAGLHQPDGIILDLEDSVAPPVKDEARLLVRNALRAVDFRGCERMVRINQGSRGLEDLDFVVPHNVHVVLIPKVEDPAQVHQVDARIHRILQSTDGAETIAAGRAGDPTVFLMPIIESALGALRAYQIATASPNVCALTIGLEDYTADIGAERTRDGRESFWARCQVVNAARAAGVQPIDSVFSDVDDSEGLRASVLEAKALGFEGKGCIHPRQIPIIHEAFAPSAAELEKARKIVAAFEQARAQGLAAVAVGSKMIDPPVVRRAQRIVRLAEALGMS